MYAYTKFAPTDKNFDFLECLLFGALISATDPGKFYLLRSIAFTVRHAFISGCLFLFGYKLYLKDVYITIQA